MAPKEYPSFPSKILLFGEYLVLKGSNAISLPYSAFKLKRVIVESDNSQKKLLWDLFTYFKTNNILSEEGLNQFAHDIEAGLGYESSIPIGYGLGSSGALSADLYYHYFDKQVNEDLNELKVQLIQIENFFHKESSGIDPLTSYIKKPIFFNQNEVEVIESKVNIDKFSLYNSGISRDAKKAIKHFKKLSHDVKFTNDILHLSDINNRIVHSFLDEILDTSLVKEFSTKQLEVMKDFIDEKTKSKWTSGLHSDEFYMKLCGAGMGGMYLIYTP